MCVKGSETTEKKDGLRDGQRLGRAQLETVQRVTQQEGFQAATLLLTGLPLHACSCLLNIMHGFELCGPIYT